MTLRRHLGMKAVSGGHEGGWWCDSLLCLNHLLHIQLLSIIRKYQVSAYINGHDHGAREEYTYMRSTRFGIMHGIDG